MSCSSGQSGGRAWSRQWREPKDRCHHVGSGFDSLQGLCFLVNDSDPPFSELFFSGSFHLPARPTSPFDFCGRQALIGERFLWIVPGAKADGARRTSVHLELRSDSTLSCRLNGWWLCLLPNQIDQYFNSACRPICRFGRHQPALR